MIVLPRIGSDALVEILLFVLAAGKQGSEFVRIVERNAQNGACPMRIATAHFARRFLENEDFGASLVGGNGCTSAAFPAPTTITS